MPDSLSRQSTAAVMPERDPDAKRPLTDAMTWGERQRLWRRVYKTERDRYKQERDDARFSARMAALEQERLAAQRDQAEADRDAMHATLDRILVCVESAQNEIAGYRAGNPTPRVIAGATLEEIRMEITGGGHGGS